MSRSLLTVTVGLSLVLSACGSKAKDAPTAPVAKEPTTEAAKPTTEPAATTPDPTRDPEAMKAATAKVDGIKKMCADSAGDRAKRQKAKPLYARLGGHDALTAVVTDIVELHATEDVTKPLLVGVDKAKLVASVVDWLGEKSGGPEKYKGKDMVTAHAKLHMTDVHFLAAGDQIHRTLEKYKVPGPEIQEVICLIVSAHDESVR